MLFSSSNPNGELVFFFKANIIELSMKYRLKFVSTMFNEKVSFSSLSLIFILLIDTNKGDVREKSDRSILETKRSSKFR